MTGEPIRNDYSNPTIAVQIAQKAPTILAKPSLISKPFPLSAISAAESPEAWSDLESVFYACLTTRDDESAHLCLERMTQRFGATNQRVMAMRGLYQEAVADSEEDIRKVLQDYNKILEETPMNVPIHKRRIALIRSVGRPQDAINSLVQFVETFPTDTEAWCELSDLYQSQGMGAQAIFSLEEALLNAPNAWNLHARLGELNYITSQSGSESAEESQRYLFNAVRRFARSIELCQDYLRGLYGLKLATEALTKVSNTGKSEPEMSKETIRELNSMATVKLQNTVQQYSSAASGTRQSELIAAQELLNRSSKS